MALPELLFVESFREAAAHLAFGILNQHFRERFIMEFLRGDNPKILLGLTISQIISASLFIVALAIFILKAIECKKRPTISK